MAVRKAELGTTRIGWIGTGVMGRWMCQHLMAKGYKATVYNRTQGQGPAAAGPGGDMGRQRRRPWPSSRTWCSRSSAFPKDVREVFLGPDGRLAGSKPGTVLVDMTTSEPTLAKEIYEAAAKAKGVASLDAPVSGGDVGAKNAALSIMVGGDAEVVEAVRPLFECMGKTIVHQGAAGCRPAHQDGQPDPDFQQHDRACARLCSTATRRG